MAGIKFHGAIDTVIRGNHIYKNCRGIWLDWMAQGTRVSQNLFHDNVSEDLFFEVDHGPFVVDNNLFLSRASLLDMSEGGAYAYNLFTGKITNRPEPNRETPYHPAHSTTVTGLATIKGGDDRFLNNIFIGTGQSQTNRSKPDAQGWISGYGLWEYDGRGPILARGNVYYWGAHPYEQDTNAALLPSINPKVKLLPEGDRFILQFNAGPELTQVSTVEVTAALLGKARVPGLPFEDANGSPLRIQTDYFGHARDSIRPAPGPFEGGAFDRGAAAVW